MPYADFHVHGNFKTFFSGYDVADKKSPWEPITIWAETILWKKRNRVLRSQSCFRQLHDGDLKLGVMPLYSAERGFVDSGGLKILDFLSPLIDSRLFKDIRTNKKTYWQQLDDCYKHLLRATTDNANGDEKKIGFTRCFEDCEDLKKKGHMIIVFSMEGAHCFLDSPDDVSTPAGMAKIIGRINKYKKRDPQNAEPRVFILNHTHLTQSLFSNHAFGIKFINHNDFIPGGSAISNAGLKIIETALSSDQDHYPMLIDIKHMSMQSRKEFYAFRSQYFPNIPIVASHTGCTGISHENINTYIYEINSSIVNNRKCNLVTYKMKPNGHLHNIGFNPWSINLYDEDIVEILLSDGIIGLSLDQRILGYGNLVKEKMSKTETFNGILPNKPLLTNDPEEDSGVQDAELHFRHFCNNLFHIIHIANRTQGLPTDVWKKIVIGSDFDGLIDPVDFCISGTEYKNIGEWMKLHLPALAAEANIQLPIDIDKTIKGILYDNAYEFLKKYYGKTSF